MIPTVSPVLSVAIDPFAAAPAPPPIIATVDDVNDGVCDIVIVIVAVDCVPFKDTKTGRWRVKYAVNTGDGCGCGIVDESPYIGDAPNAEASDSVKETESNEPPARAHCTGAAAAAIEFEQSRGIKVPYPFAV